MWKSMLHHLPNGYFGCLLNNCDSLYILYLYIYWLYIYKIILLLKKLGESNYKAPLVESA